MYLVYLPDVGRPSEPLIQKHVGRRPARLPNDQEEDQSRNPRRRRADNGIAGTEHLEVRHDRRVSQRRVELAPPVPRFDEVFCVVGVPAEVREVFTLNSSRDANLSKKLAAAPTSNIARAPLALLGGIIDAHKLLRRERGSLQWQG